MSKHIQNPIGFYTLFRREIMRYLKVYVQTLISPILSNILFLGVFGGMFAAREVGIDGVGYLQFMVPGLCAMGAINAGFQNPSSSLIIQKYQNTHQDLNSYPLSHLEKTLAFVLAGTLRGIMIGVLTYVATIPFVGFAIAHPAGFIVLLALVSFIFSCLGLILGLIANSFDTINFAQTIVITPLTYFGGVFFEVTQLPAFVASFAAFNPIFPIVDSVRIMYLGVGETHLASSLFIVCVFSVSLFAIAYWVMQKGYGLKT